MVQPAMDGPDWAPSLDRAGYLSLVAAIQRWLAANRPGLLAGAELRLGGGVSVPLAPLADRVAHSPEPIDDVVGAYLAELAIPSDPSAQPPAAPHVDLVAATFEEPTTHVDLVAATFEEITPSLRLRLAASAPAGSVHLDLGVPGLTAVVAREVDGRFVDVSVDEAEQWPVRGEALVEHAGLVHCACEPDSVRSMTLPLVGEVAAIEGRTAATTAHALWPERFVTRTGHYLVAVPDEHLVLVKAFSPQVLRPVVRALAEMTRDEFARSAEGVSPLLYLFTPSGVRVVEPDGSLRREQPPARPAGR